MTNLGISVEKKNKRRKTGSEKLRKVKIESEHHQSASSNGGGVCISDGRIFWEIFGNQQWVAAAGGHCC